MSQSPQTTDPQPRDDRTTVAIAWAVGAVAFAAAAAFIAWLALGQGGGGNEAAPPAETSEAAPSVPGSADPEPQPTPGQDEPSDGGESEQGEGAEGGPSEGGAPDSAQQTPSPEIVELLLSLQRRDDADTMAVGDVDAPVVMIEYADYRCPYCARFHLDIRPDLAPAIEDGTLRIEFRDMVIFDETSELAAVAGRAAAEQGHLEEFQKGVFALSSEGHGEYGSAELIDIAREVGVEDIEQFEEDLESEELLAAVRADTAEGREVGVSSTPTFLINTQVIQGAYPAEHLLSIIEQEHQAVQDGESQGR